jgi:hypothetical protein
VKKILLDENIHQAAYKLFVDVEAITVGYMKWNGISNGKLLALADQLFDVLITADKNIPYQQSLVDRRISVIVIKSGRLDFISAHMGQLMSVIHYIAPGTFQNLDSI